MIGLFIVVVVVWTKRRDIFISFFVCGLIINGKRGLLYTYDAPNKPVRIVLCDLSIILRKKKEISSLLHAAVGTDDHYSCQIKLLSPLKFIARPLFNH